MSQTIRAYLPATLTSLAELREQGELAANWPAYAVTPALREQLGGSDAGFAGKHRETDPEELSYAAFRIAADESVRLLRDDPAAPPRRVVISADTPAAWSADAGARVRLTSPVELASVAAIHVDGAAAEAEVAAAVASDDPAVDHELEWYDVSELSQLLA